MEFTSNQMFSAGLSWNPQDSQNQMQQQHMHQQQMTFEATNFICNLQSAAAQQNANQILYAAQQEAAKIISDAKIEATEYYRNYETSLQNYEAEINEMKEALKNAGHASQIYLEENLEKAANAKKMVDECNNTIDKIMNPLNEFQLFTSLYKLNQLGLLQDGSAASLKYNLLKDRFL